HADHREIERTPSAHLPGGEVVRERECIKHHRETGVEQSVEGKDRNAHGVNGLKVGSYDNTGSALHRLHRSPYAVETETCRTSEEVTSGSIKSEPLVAFIASLPMAQMALKLSFSPLATTMSGALRTHQSAHPRNKEITMKVMAVGSIVKPLTPE